MNVNMHHSPVRFKYECSYCVSAALFWPLWNFSAPSKNCFDLRT